MKQAIDSLLVAKLTDKTVENAAAAIVTEVMNDLGTKLVYSEIFSDNIVNMKILDEAYKNLQLNGSESFVEMYIKIDRLTRRQLKVFEQPDKDWWDEELNAITTQPPKFLWRPLWNRNYFLDIPVKWTVYPAFHIHRPRFFNTAAFYREALRIIRQDFWNEVFPVDLAYKNYAGWLEKGNHDLHLPGFKMTSRQMFWLSYTHVATEKYQRGVSKRFELANQLTNNYMHVILKSKSDFRNDFHCDEMSPKETELLEEFEKIKMHLNDAVWFKSLASEYLRHGYFEDEEKNFFLTKLNKPGFLDFVESGVLDPSHAGDVKTMRDLLKENRFLLANFNKVFSSLCVTEESCRFFF